MPSAPRKNTPILAALLLLAIGVIVFVFLRDRGSPPPPGPDPRTAALGLRPSEEEWNALKIYDGVLTEDQFVKALRELYTWNCNGEEFIETDPGSVRIATFDGKRVAVALAPASSGPTKTPARYWRPVTALEPAPEGKPLQGLRIAIDPGHLGGDYARMEERWYKLGDDSKEVAEGDMTLATARILKPQLEALGAVVTLVRDDTQPLTPSTPKDFLTYAREQYRGMPKKELQRKSEQLFYRAAEIRARAKRVNEEIKPDLILCLHYNAENWGGDPSAPILTSVNHFHLIVHGAYMPGEIAHEDERLEMLHKIFQGTHTEEIALARELVTAFKRETSLFTWAYKVDAPAIQVSDGLWARNLLANRLYRCPVLFFEPYVMNNEVVFERVQAGDYEGEREIAGVLRKSLFREYTHAVVSGLVNYYEPSRK